MTGNNRKKRLVWAAWIGLHLVGLCPALALADSARLPEEPREIQQARENLKISLTTRDRIAGELEALRSSGKTTPEVLMAYETYLARVQDIVAENQNMLARMESAYAVHRSQPLPRGFEIPGNEGGSKITDQGKDAVDEVQALDRKLNESLAAFDELLLKELRLIAAASAKRLQGLAEAAAEAAKDAAGKEGGASPDDTATDASAAEKGDEDAGKEKRPVEPGQGSVPPGRGKHGQGEAQDQGGGRGSGGSGASPSDYASSADDDIVARQLREAAEKETDPVLKAKLWKEYEDYRKSRAKP